jgi:hypothetical protein
MSRKYPATSLLVPPGTFWWHTWGPQKDVCCGSSTLIATSSSMARERLDDMRRRGLLSLNQYLDEIDQLAHHQELDAAAIADEAAAAVVDDAEEEE